MELPLLCRAQSELIAGEICPAEGSARLANPMLVNPLGPVYDVSDPVSLFSGSPASTGQVTNAGDSR